MRNPGIRFVIRSWLLTVLGISLGCGNQESMPQTYPVTGTITSMAGKPYRGGVIQFRLEENQEITVTGNIDEKGGFRLITIKGNKRAEGAPPGFYVVAISPAIGKDRKMPFFPFTLAKKYQVEASENHFEIQIDPPAK